MEVHLSGIPAVAIVSNVPQGKSRSCILLIRAKLSVALSQDAVINQFPVGRGRVPRTAQSQFTLEEFRKVPEPLAKILWNQERANRRLEQLIHRSLSAGGTDPLSVDQIVANIHEMFERAPKPATVEPKQKDRK